MLNLEKTAADLRRTAAIATAAANALTGKKPAGRVLSKDARRRIAEAQKARWAKNKPAAGTGGPQPLGTRKAA